MPNEKNPAPKPSKIPEENSKIIPVSPKDEAEAKKIAELCLSPEFNAARLTCTFGPSSLDFAEAAGMLAEHARATNNGDLSHAEAMLLNQAHALQAMFVNLAERAQKQTRIPQIQCLMGLALKAQAQCRATLQTMVEVKFPKSATFIRQANIAHQDGAGAEGASAMPGDAANHGRSRSALMTLVLYRSPRRRLFQQAV
jgi:hypothetical protein